MDRESKKDIGCLGCLVIMVAAIILFIIANFTQGIMIFSGLKYIFS